MVHKFKISIVFVILMNLSCGGGGGEYVPPKVIIDKIGIIKKEIFSPIDVVSKVILESSLDRRPNEKYFPGGRYYYFNEFNFKNKKYLLAVPLDKFVSIFDSRENEVKRLSTPRYTVNAAAIELLGKKHNRFLAVYIAQQETSHSSTLYILNDYFKIVYEEHLLGALWMAKEPSEIGDNLIISSETRWIPNDEWISVGGPWRYIIFGSSSN